MTFCGFCERIEQQDCEQSYLPSVVHFKPLHPVTPGHRLFVPRAHVADAAADAAVTAVTMAAAARWVAEQDIEANIITSVGPNATQTVFHLHIHVVPRHPGDELALPWTGQRRPTVGDSVAAAQLGMLRPPEPEVRYVGVPLYPPMTERYR